MGLERCVLRVEGLDCPTEVSAIRGALADQSGIHSLGFDLIQGQVAIEYDPALAGSADRWVDLMERRAGLAARIVVGPSPRVGEMGSGSTAPWRIWAAPVVTGVTLVAASVLEWRGQTPLAVAGYVGAVAIALVTILPRALRSLRQRRLDMHVLMTLAIVGALVLGQWSEAATVAFLFGLAQALERMSLERARRAVRQLLELQPEEAERIAPDGTVERVRASELVVGDRVRVRSGQRIPIDGRVLSGRSLVDQKSITGESVGVLREAGDSVFAGTVNGDGALEVEATSPPDETVVARVVEQVRSSQASRAPIEREIERFAAVYTPLVIALAVAIMIGPPLLHQLTGASIGSSGWSSWLLRGLVVLVTACPCALVIGTPVAIVCGLARAARRGILIKGGPYLEAFGRLKVLAFDKTGTLTRGEPEIVGVHPASGRDPQWMLRVAAALGDRGGHVLGQAIARHARTLRLDVPEAQQYQAVPGLGATGQIDAVAYHVGSHRYLHETGLCREPFHGVIATAETGVGTAVAVADPDEPLGWIRLADPARGEASAVLAELRGLGLRSVMLTGDNLPTALAVAEQLGLDDQRAGMLPAEKAEAVREIAAEYGPTGMVGDGVNDAPALAAAQVSVALGGLSSTVAMDTADIVLLADDLTGLPWLVRHSRATIARIRQNTAIAIGSKLAVLVLAVLGMASLWMAIAADVGVSMLVVANSLRLLRRE